MISVHCEQETKRWYRPIHDVSVPGFQILNLLGRGATSIVCSGIDLASGEDVAVKILCGEDPVQHARFHREIEVMMVLRGEPGFVQLKRHGRHNVWRQWERPWYSMTLADETLKDRWRRSPWSPQRAAEVVASLARTVSRLHALNVVHRDLKPTNIFYARTAGFLIGDMGLAKSRCEEGFTEPWQVIATPGYCAPESYQWGIKYAGPSVDIFSLASILFFILAGQLPPESANHDRWANYVLRQPTRRPSSFQVAIPSELDAICLRGLSRDPDERYMSAGNLADDLDAFVHGKPLTAITRGWMHV